MQQSHSSREMLKLASASYIPLIGFLVLARYHRDKFLAFHALQGSFFTLWFLVAYFSVRNYGGIISLLFIALAATGFIYTAGGKDFRIPLLSDFVDWLIKIFDKSKTTA